MHEAKEAAWFYLLCLTRGRKPTVMEAIGMLVMPEFFTYRSLQRMTGGCKDVAILRGSALPGAALTQVCSVAAPRYA